MVIMLSNLAEYIRVRVAELADILQQESAWDDGVMIMLSRVL